MAAGPPAAGCAPGERRPPPGNAAPPPPSAQPAAAWRHSRVTASNGLGPGTGLRALLQGLSGRRSCSRPASQEARTL